MQNLPTASAFVIGQDHPQNINPGASDPLTTDKMVGVPAVILSMLSLTLLLPSVLGQTEGNSTASTASPSPSGSKQPEISTAEPNANISTADTSPGANATNNIDSGPVYSSRSTDVTERTTPASTTLGITSGRAGGGPGVMTDSRAGQSTATPAADSSASSSTAIAVCLLVLIIALVLVIYFLSLLQSRQWAVAVQAAVVRFANRARAVLSRIAVWAWPWKSEGLGESDDEDEDGGVGAREADLELGKARDAERGEEKKEEEEEEDSSDDYSSMEGFDLRERDGGGEEGKERGNKQRDENKEDEEKDGELILLDGSKEDEMEECDLTVL
ncbi:hypothetical protein GJAV_G00066020 [Gymnothorax javanicus]|nr:hypothetical protein GJAV_G00066020 [Gymnothorax javanicus]